MATDLELGAGEYSTPEATLTAGEVWTVTFPDYVRNVEVVSDGAAKVRWTCDGSTPTATHGWFLPALPIVDTRSPSVGGRTVIKVWSPGTPTVVAQLA